MAEELTFERILKDRTMYIKYYLSHNLNSFFLTVRYMMRNHLEYEIHAIITINFDSLTSEILDKIEKESMKLFKESYNFLNYRKAYKLIAVILLLLTKYKIIKYKRLADSNIVEISYEVVKGENLKKIYNLEPRNFLKLVKKLNRFFKENKLYSETET